jgi:hypothetical protein
VGPLPLEPCPAATPRRDVQRSGAADGRDRTPDLGYRNASWVIGDSLAKAGTELFRRATNGSADVGIPLAAVGPTYIYPPPLNLVPRAR